MKKQLGNQTKLADVAGVSQPTVQRWLVGDKVPDANDLCRLADFFNVSVDAILGRAELNLPPVEAASKRRGEDLPDKYPAQRPDYLLLNEKPKLSSSATGAAGRLLKKGAASVVKRAAP